MTLDCANSKSACARQAVLVRGLVQGIGFRPFVHRLARRLELGGFVCNHVEGVRIEIEGDAWRLTSFVELLRNECPELARIEGIQVRELAPSGETRFRIEKSRRSEQNDDRFFSPDLGTCQDCLRELFDPANRRYGYPFINCTQCGPRLTIVREAPYDREGTTMAAFAMCDACRKEYENPSDRRFHAQPIACAACGPRLVVQGDDGRPLDREPLAFFREVVLSDQIVALKGLGGYHLACDATSEHAVRMLRSRKGRYEKPFAVMAADLDAVRRLCLVSAIEAELLASARRPIVLLRRLSSSGIAEAVAPGNPLLGVMLPYTPLHHLLAHAVGARPVVLTSGNRSDGPIVFQDASTALRGIADGFLTHDRPIHSSCDDSVVRVLADRPVLLRRARGYAPEAVHLPSPLTRKILAVGGHSKSTFALGRGAHAFLSHHLGDLGDYDAYRAFCSAVVHYQTLFAFQPDVLVHDLHPGYATTEYALARQREDGALRLLGVQHHHAHTTSCMAENGVAGPVIGVTFDGSGYGTDGSLWGGEFLIADYRSFRRAAHVRAVRLPGGEQAVREPWRMALSHLIDACDGEIGPCLDGIASRDIRLVRSVIEKGFNSPLTTSVGRLFDAVAALVGLRMRVSFEGQAAMELEWLAAQSDTQRAYPFDVTSTADGALAIDTRPVIRSVVDDVGRGESALQIAGCFHQTVVRMIVTVVSRLRESTGIEEVTLSGGVFGNALLLENAKRDLEQRGLRVYTHARVPTNDGGLSLGQLAIAAAWEGGR